jgi:hypothetical protein
MVVADAPIRSTQGELVLVETIPAHRVRELEEHYALSLAPRSTSRPPLPWTGITLINPGLANRRAWQNR